MAGKRIRMLSIVQEGALSDAQIGSLQRGARQLYAAHFGSGFKLVPVWLSAPAGQACIAARPSTASTVSLSVADGTDDAKRHAFMSAFCSMWMAETGCHQNEILCTVMDQALSDAYASRSLARINPTTRMFHVLRLVMKLLGTRLRRGHRGMSLNFSD